MSLLQGRADETLEELLGVNRAGGFDGAEREHPDLLLAVWPASLAGALHASAGRELALHVEPSAAHELTHQQWYGRANRLSRGDPVAWQAIDAVALASRKPATAPHEIDVADSPVLARDGSADADGPTARQIILQRRSLQACDGRTSIPAERFYKMLARVMPNVELPAMQRPAPWDVILWAPALHLGLFVHRMEGLEPGLYVLPRDPATAGKLRRAMDPRFAWTAPPACPADSLLRLLEPGDARRLATQVSCSQDIAGDGAFALGMIAECQENLFAHGPWSCRRLFWEAGLIGQVLYLEAEAARLRARGIGCYFNDPVHRVFGLSGMAFQSLYHFTVGGAIEDARLTTFVPYGGSSSR